MAVTHNLTRAEALERARLLEVTSYDITADLTTEQTFRSVTEVRFRCREPGASSFIELAADRLRSATLNGEPVDTTGWSARAGLPLTGLAAENLLRVDADFAYSRTGQGLTRSVDPVDGEVYLHSQFEIAHAQRVFGCFDQPDLKSVYTWHVTAPAHWRVLSNSPVDTVEQDGPHQTVHFAPSVRMSTYITALCAGPFHEVRRRHDGIDMGYLCRASMAPYLDVDLDDLHETTSQGFDFFHAQFQARYPLPKYDQLWAPDFNAGAMENFGLVVHSEAEYLFRSQVTGYEYEQRANTILHELAHMWFGNLVTMRWWDDLWLNESFAEWASHWCNANATRFTDAWTTFLSLRKAWGYRQDQLSSTHPVYAPAPDVVTVEANFDGITYAKGASVLKQLVAYVGEPAFVAGLRSYFAGHAWGNASFDDLLSALSAASGRELRQFAAEWLETAQVSTLRPELTVGDDGRYRQLVIRQEVPPEHPTLRTHRLGIGLYDVDGAKLVRRQQLELDVSGAATEVPGLAGERAADLLLLNDDDLSYTKIRLDPGSMTTLVDHLAGLHSPLARALCWAAAWDMLRDAELPARSWLTLALRGLPTETDINLVTTTLRQASTALALYADPEWTAGGWQRLADTARQQLAVAPGNGRQLAWARTFAQAAASDADLATLRGWLDGVDIPDRLVVDTELRWLLLQSLVAAGAAGDAEIDAELAADPTAAGQREATTARALRPTAAAKQRAWAAVTNEVALPNWQHRATLRGFWHPAQVAVTEPYVAAFHEQAHDVFGRRDGDQAREFLRMGYPHYHITETTAAASNAWLADATRPAVARRLVAEGRDAIVRALAARATDAAAPAPPTLD